MGGEENEEGRGQESRDKRLATRADKESWLWQERPREQQTSENAINTETHTTTTKGGERQTQREKWEGAASHEWRGRALTGAVAVAAARVRAARTLRETHTRTRAGQEHTGEERTGEENGAGER